MHQIACRAGHGASDTPARIATSSTCRICPSVIALNRVSG